jgi:hypothetical protein
MKSVLICILFYLPLSHASALTDAKLVTILNDQNAVTDDLDLTLNAQGVVQGVAYIADDAGTKTEDDFTLADLASTNGAVLVAQQGVNALLLTGTVDSTKGTGALVIHYIYNGLTGVYDSCNMNLVRNTAGTWILMNAYTNQPVTSAKIVTYSIGIKTIQGICPN